VVVVLGIEVVVSRRGGNESMPISGGERMGGNSALSLPLSYPVPR
jgi:hypothetical protein